MAVIRKYNFIINIFYPHLMTFLSLLSKREEGWWEGGESEQARNIDVRETLIFALYMHPDWSMNLQPPGIYRD